MFSVPGLQIRIKDDHFYCKNIYSYNSSGFIYFFGNSYLCDDDSISSVYSHVAVPYDQNFGSLLDSFDFKFLVTNRYSFNSFSESHFYTFYSFNSGGSICTRVDDLQLYFKFDGDLYVLDSNRVPLRIGDCSNSFYTLIINDGFTNYYDLYCSLDFSGNYYPHLDGIYYFILHYFDLEISDIHSCLNFGGVSCDNDCEYFDLKPKNHSQQIIGACRSLNGNLYCCKSGSADSDDFYNDSYLLSTNEVIDFYDYYFSGINSNVFVHQINLFGKSCILEVRYVDVASDESVLALKDSLDCICTAVNSVSSNITSLKNQQISNNSSLLSKLGFYGDNFVKALNLTYEDDSLGLRGYGSVFDWNCNRPLAINPCNNVFKIEHTNNLDVYVKELPTIGFAVNRIPVSIESIPNINADVDIGSMPTSRVVTLLNPPDFTNIVKELNDIDLGVTGFATALTTSLGSLISTVYNFSELFKTSCDTSIGQAFGEAFNLINCQGSVFKANDNDWNDEDTISGLLFKSLNYNYVLNNSFYSPFYHSFDHNGRKSVGLAQLIEGAFYSSYSDSGKVNSVFNLQWNGSPYKFADIFANAFFYRNPKSGNSNYVSNLESVFLLSGVSDNFKILNHSCGVNPVSLKSCEPIEISQSDDSGEPVPLKIDWKPLLDLLCEALFCQFGNSSSSPRSSWVYSVFNKLLFPNNSNDCNDKVGLSELDFSEGFVPDNIFVNSNGLVARFNSEIYK